MKQHLQLITELLNDSEPKGIYLKDGKLYLDNIEVSSSIFTELDLVHLNELQSELLSRNYMIWPKVFTIDDNLYYGFKDNYSLENPLILSEEYTKSTEDCKKFSSELLDIDDDEFNKLFLNIMNFSGSNNEGIQLYYQLSALYDLIKEQTTVDIINHNDPSYTNIVNLSKFARNNSTCNLTVSYTKNNLILTKDFMFKLVDNDCNSLNFLAALDETSGCMIEYQDYCIRVFPGTNISECIITNCFVTYEYK